MTDGMVADFDPNTPGIQPDGNINYAAGDRNAGQSPSLTAAGYTNSFAGPPSPTGVTPPTRTTELYGIDTNRDVLVLQNPPNDGTLTTVGRRGLGFDFNQTGGFNVGRGEDAFAISGSSLYTIDLDRGTAEKVLNVPNADYFGLAMPVPNQRRR